jgi:hypothetical protein
VFILEVGKVAPVSEPVAMASHRARKKQRSSDVDSKPFSPLLDQENSDVLTSSGL